MGPGEPRSTPGQDESRPRRSLLYVPGENARALAKARSLEADGWILDLEDAVAPESKETARAAVEEALEQGFPREVAVRVNASGTPEHAADLAVAAAADAVVLPKVGRADDVAEAAEALDRIGSTAQLWLMVETPGAVLDLPSLVRGSDRVTVLVMGTNDLAAALRLPADPTRAGLLTSLSRTVLVARDTGCEVIDGVFGSVADPEGLASECRQGRALGFDGKTLIHPGQIAAANEIYGPSAGEVDAARSLVAAWGSGSSGVIVHEGRLAEQLHVDAARRILDVHTAIAARDRAVAGG